MSDRERLAQLAKDRQAHRRKQAIVAESLKQRQLADLADRQANDERFTKVLFKYCNLTFAGFRLPESKHELLVNLDGPTRVSISVTHTMPITKDFQGRITLFAVHVDQGLFQFFERGDRMKESFKSLDAIKPKMLEFVADCGTKYLAEVFTEIGQRR